MYLTRSMLIKCLLFLDDPKHKIIISENMERIVLYIWTKVHIPELFTCTKTNCSNRWHICDIDNLFDDICNALRVSSLETISTCKKHRVKITLHDYVKEAHTEARNCYILWHDMGKPKHGPIC